MTELRITVGPSIGDELAAAFRAMQLPIASAASAAVKFAGEKLKTLGRAHIGAAGFSAKWQNTWKVRYYPPNTETIDQAAYAYHLIPYSLVFEDGAKIAGKPMLWVPLPGTPKVGRGRPSPSKLIRSGIRLFTIARPGQRPLLAANIRQTRAQAANPSKAVSLAKLKAGSKSSKSKAALFATPLFFGITGVRMPDRFDLQKVADEQRDQLEIYYNQHLKVD